MKLLIIALSVLSLSSFGKVPKFKTTKEMKVSQMAQGPEVELKLLIDLPMGQKINEGAHSYIKVHEKVHGKGWTLVENINVRENVLLKGMDINLQRKLKLAHASSNIMVSATIVHCANDNSGGCYIDNFQKEIERKANTPLSSNITFLPTKY